MDRQRKLLNVSTGINLHKFNVIFIEILLNCYYLNILLGLKPLVPLFTRSMPIVKPIYKLLCMKKQERKPRMH